MELGYFFSSVLGVAEGCSGLGKKGNLSSTYSEEAPEFLVLTRLPGKSVDIIFGGLEKLSHISARNMVTVTETSEFYSENSGREQDSVKSWSAPIS